MKKLVLILQAVTLLAVSNIAYADTVTGHVEAVSYCEYGQDAFVNLINIDGSWYQGTQRGATSNNGYYIQFYMNMTVPLAAMTAGKTVTLVFSPASVTTCGKSIVGYAEWTSAGGYGDIQINAN